MWALVITEWKLSPERVAAFFSLTPSPSPKGEGSEQRVIPMVVLPTSSNQQSVSVGLERGGVNSVLSLYN